MISNNKLKQILKYNQETGIFIWLISPSKGTKAGAIAGCTGKDGYRYIRINRKGYKAHRLAYLYMTGKFPNKHIDHINRVRDDNRWSNLRDADPSLNAKNISISKRNSTGVTGVYKRGDRYVARIQTNGYRKFLGVTDDRFEAICMRKSAEIKEWGQKIPNTCIKMLGKNGAGTPKTVMLQQVLCHDQK